MKIKPIDTLIDLSYFTEIESITVKRTKLPRKLKKKNKKEGILRITANIIPIVTASEISIPIGFIKK